MTRLLSLLSQRNRKNMAEKVTVPNSIQHLIREQGNDFWNFAGLSINHGEIPLNAWVFIAESGTFNRIFRRWYQTTWLAGNWCDSFNGTTPMQFVRMNAENLFPENHSHWYVSCYIDETALSADKAPALRMYMVPYSTNCHGDESEYLPVITAFKALEGFFLKGVSISSDGKLSNVFKDRWRNYLCLDVDFLPWAAQVLWDKGLLEFKASSLPKKGKASLNSQGKAYFSFEPQYQLPSFLKCFILGAASRIINSMERHIVIGREKTISRQKRTIFFDELVSMIKNVFGSASWVDVDEFLLAFWDVLVKLFPDRFLPGQAVCDIEKDREYWKRKEPFRAIMTKCAFYDLALAFDRYFLFPLNWYFGLAECVWTDREQVGKALTSYFSYAKHLSGKSYFNRMDRDSLKMFYDCFFSPCTSFRVTDRIEDDFFVMPGG